MKKADTRAAATCVEATDRIRGDFGQWTSARKSAVEPSAQRTFAGYAHAPGRSGALWASAAGRRGPGTSVHTHCVAVSGAGRELQLNTSSGVVSLRFFPNPGVSEALAALNGVQVTCTIIEN